MFIVGDEEVDTIMGNPELIYFYEKFIVHKYDQHASYNYCLTFKELMPVVERIHNTKINFTPEHKCFLHFIRNSFQSNFKFGLQFHEICKGKNFNSPCCKFCYYKSFCWFYSQISILKSR